MAKRILNKTGIRTKSAACLSLALVVTFSFALQSLKDGNGTSAEVADAIERGVTFEDVTGTVDLTGVALANLTPSALKAIGDTGAKNTGKETLIVRLEGESLSDRTPDGMTVAEYIKTPDGQRASSRITSAHEELLREIDGLGISYTLAYDYRALINAVAIEVNVAYAAAIKALGGVSSVVGATTYAYPEETVGYTTDDVTMNGSVEEIYGTGIYNSQSFTEQGYDGSGVTVAILDTGLDYTHPAFATNSISVESFTRSTISDAVNGSQKLNAVTRSAQKGVTITANDLYVSAKVPFAYDYADSDPDVYPSYSQHGPHVAGIVAGSCDSYTDKDGNTVLDENGDPVTFRGVAPGAQLVICKTFTDDLTDTERLGGAVSEDLIAALEDCTILGVDVINMSLGTSCGFSSVVIDGDTEGALLNECYENVRKAGINLICAASNEYSSAYGGNFGTNLSSNPDSGTVGSPSTFTGALSVASINGQLSPYFIANGKDTVYFDKSSDANSVQFDFLQQMLGDGQRDTFKYIMIPGYGRASDYTADVRSAMQSKGSNGKIVVVVRRGSNTFQEKVELAMTMGADAIIVYNNVAGKVRMSLGEVEDPIPAISISMNAGALLESGATLTNRVRTGTFTLDRSFVAGPFMNDYSSWGPTSDLKLKPEVTIYGGEVTSAVSGGFAEMSGTSMAAPNMAGLAALALSYMKDNRNTQTYAGAISDIISQSGITNSTIAEKSAYTKLINQLAMSTATVVNDEDGDPVSPRKQGAGLVSLVNMLSSGAYLSTDDGEENRPKVELGDDKEKKGVYTLAFNVNNFSNTPIEYEFQAIFMTETLSADGLTVAEKAYLLSGNAVWTVNGKTYHDGDKLTFSAGTTKVSVVLTLTDTEKAYLDKSFENGMFIEGFIQLLASDGGACNLTLPFVGFYGDFRSAPMLDYDAFQIADFEQDSSLLEEQKPKASTWATQAYGSYYNAQYNIPLGSYLYLQDENAEQIYANRDHAAVSQFNEYFGDSEAGNYLTTTAIRGLYVGLLRNAELVTYVVKNVETGEIILEAEDYRVGKAHTSGGSTVPGFVDMKLNPKELGLVNNGKYSIDFNFYFDASEKDMEIPVENTYSMTFYVDYEAPVLEDVQLRYYNYKDGNIEKQRIYLDLYVYDNHYAQSAMLCYRTPRASDPTSSELLLATEYITPIYNAVKNGTNIVTIEVTDIIDDYRSKLYVQLDDYALNHSVYQIVFTNANASVLPDTFSLAAGEENITLSINGTHKVALDYEGSADLSNFFWSSSRTAVADVKNGTIVGLKEGTAKIYVENGNGVRQTINVTVTSEVTPVTLRGLSFGTLINADYNVVKASGYVTVSPGQAFDLELLPEPWFYDFSSNDDYEVRWTTSNEHLATVDNGYVTIQDNVWDENGTRTFTARGTVTVQAVVYNKQTGRPTSVYSSVSFIVRDSFTVSNYSLTAYRGNAAEVWIPSDQNIMSIGENAFRYNTTVEILHVPKTVATINEYAFRGCTKLRKIIFEDSDSSDDIADAGLNLINQGAFTDCKALETVDFSNCKSVTVGSAAFSGCSSLKEIIGMEKVSTMHSFTMLNCTSLEEIDLSGLHMSGEYVFAGCTSLRSVKTAEYSAIGENMFYGCTSLAGDIVINSKSVGAYAFANTRISSVTFTNPDTTIGESAFEGCSLLRTVSFGNDVTVYSIGDNAFKDCTQLSALAVPNADAVLGFEIVAGTNCTVTLGNYTNYTGGALVTSDGVLLLVSPTATTVSLANVKEIAPYAFSGSRITSLTIPASVEKIGEGAFADCGSLTTVTFASGSPLTALPAYAFYRCDALTTVTMPSSVKTLGDYAFSGCTALTSLNNVLQYVTTLASYVFAGCNSLTSVTLDGIAAMGDGNFRDCSKLESAELPDVKEMGTGNFLGTALTSVTFGANAETTGSYTFGAYIFYRGQIVADSLTTLTTVNLGGVKEIGEGAFLECSKLATVNGSSFTVIGVGAFSGCSSLSSISLSQVEVFGNDAFYGASSLTDANLASATAIGMGAFYNASSVKTLSIPQVKEIGGTAFANTAISSLELPASVEKIGAGAFASCIWLRTVTVANGNANFFAEDNVLYRNISDGAYEIVLYPGARAALSGYTVKEGTVSVAALAFNGLGQNVLKSVVLPYSVKTIGDGAFYQSGVSTYEFQSIQAPTLLSTFNEEVNRKLTVVTDGVENVVFYGMYYSNFNGLLLDCFDNFMNDMSTSNSTLTMRIPENGVGYNGYLYSHYFGTSVSLGILIDDDTRTVLSDLKDYKTMLDTVKTWQTSGFAVNDENKATVVAFSDRVKETHRMYLSIRDEDQLAFLKDDIGTLSEIENELRSVKTKFNISATIASITFAEGSCKTQYKAGETLDLSGLAVIVQYDDYYEERVELTEYVFDTYSTKPDTPLTKYDVQVTLIYLGQPVFVDITVSEETDDEGNTGSKGCKGCNSSVTGTVAAVFGVLVTVSALCMVRKRGGKHE